MRKNTISTADYGASGDNLSAIETTASYDAFGNIIEERRANGSKTLYSYDAKNRVTEKRQYNAAGAEKYRTVYTYYGNDLLKEMYDYKVSGTSLRLYHYVYNTYDGLNRLTSQAEVSGSSVPSDLSPYTVTYTYDLKDRLSAVSYGSASGSEVDGMIYHYSGNMLTDVSVKIGSNTYLAKAYTYNADGSVQTVKDYYNFRNGDTANYLLLSYSYDAFGRVTDLQYSKAGEKVEQHSYAYDKNSNIIRESNFNTFSELDEIRSYTYDNLNQLTDSVFKNIITETVTVEGEADEDGNPTTTTQTVTREEEALTTSYAYDIVGNRIQKVENGAATNYTYNSLNQLMSEKGTGTNLTYSYDENGNQTGITGTSGGSNVNKTFTYTPEDMLETYTEGTVSQTNLYDGEGQRVQKKEGSNVTNYFYQEGSVLYTTDANGNLKAFNLLNEDDAFGTARKSETAEDYYLYTDDLKRSTVNVLDSSAGKVASYWYNDFGEVTESKASSYSSFNNEQQYTGAVYDDSTGLLYLNARFYDPQTGRFISRDTYRGEQDDAGTWHLYLYCANNPVNYVDPSGHKRVRQYSAAKTFKYKKYHFLGGLSVSIVVKWDAKGNKIVFCNSYISRKNAYGIAKIKKIAKREISFRNNKQRAYVRHHITIVPFQFPTINPDKLSVPLPTDSFCHPSAIVYSDGGIDWYKEGIRWRF